MWLNVTSGAVRVARCSQQNPPNCYSKLAQSHFEGGSPVKFQGSKYLGTWQHSAQTQATSLPQAPLAALFRKTTTNKVKYDRERDRWPASSDFSLQSIQVTDTHILFALLVCYCSSSIQAPCFSLLNLNVTLYIFFWHCHVMLFYFIYCFYLFKFMCVYF